MKSWRGLEEEKDIVETALHDAGAILSRSLHNRVKELIIKLSKFKDITIKYLKMGNGTYVLGMKAPWREEFKGLVDEGVHDVDIGDFNDSGGHPKEIYEAVNPGIGAVAYELEEILMLLTDKHYLSLMYINEDEMVKLLSNKTIKKKKSAKKS